MKNLKSILASYLLAILAITAFVGCDKCIESDDVEMPYLSLTSEKSMEDFTSEDWAIFKEAFNRLDVKLDSDGTSTILQLSGQEVNISEELYQLLHMLIKNGNKTINGNGIANNYQTRSMSTDCVAVCIAHIGNLNYNTVVNWINSKYGSTGVLIDDVYDATNHFLVATEISVPISTAAWDMGPIMAIVTANGGLHAVVVENLLGQYILTYDPQRKRDNPDLTNEQCRNLYPYEYVLKAIQSSGVR